MANGGEHKFAYVVGFLSLGSLLVWSAVNNTGIFESIFEIFSGQQPIAGTPQITASSTANGQSGETGTLVPVTGSTVANSVVDYAVAQVGLPYVYGGDGPPGSAGYDCSGLCYMAYKNAGISIPRTTFVQITSGTGVPVSQAQPSDLLFPYPGHVVMCIGNGMCVEARHTGTTIWTRPYQNSEFIACRRFVNA